MKTCLPRVFRSALPWLPVIVAALLIPACVAPTGDDNEDEPTAVTTEALDSTVDGGQDGPNHGTCNTPECLKLGGAAKAPGAP